MKKRLAFILGIRPDVIRAALVINQLRRYTDMEMVFIWSGQHYSDNLKSIFFRELDIEPAEIDLGCGGATDAEVVASVVSRLFPVLEKMQPAAAVFLGHLAPTRRLTMPFLQFLLAGLKEAHLNPALRSQHGSIPGSRSIPP